jgi:hypothetical protein
MKKSIFSLPINLDFKGEAQNAILRTQKFNCGPISVRDCPAGQTPLESAMRESRHRCAAFLIAATSQPSKFMRRRIFVFSPLFLWNLEWDLISLGQQYSGE